MMSSGRVVSRLNTVLNHIRFRPMSSFNYPKLPQVTLNLEKAEAEVIVPGYSYGDLDRMGNVNFWRLTAAADFGRRLVHAYPHTDMVLRFNEHYTDFMVFMIGAHYKIMPSFYKREHYYQPLKFVYFVPHIGKQSYIEAQECYSMETGELISKNDVHAVCVDAKTRKPANIPSFFNNGLKRFHSEREIPKRIDFIVKPKDTMTIQTSPKWSSSDANQHTNHSQYWKFVQDSLTELGYAGELEDVKGDLASYQLEDVKGLYLGETIPNDQLSIHVWLLENKKYGVQIDCREKSVFQATIVWS